MINRFETYFYANYAYFTTETDKFKTLGRFENFVFVIMSTRKNIRLIARASWLIPWQSIILILRIWGECLFISKELGSTGNYFEGFWEQAHSFGDLGSPAK